MQEFLQDGRMIEVILALVALEAGVLIAWFRFTGRGVAPISLVVNLMAGAFLLLALLAVLHNSSFWTLGLCLAAALLAHIADLAIRWNDNGRINPSLGEMVTTRPRFFERSL
jgi:hypothetical protein